MQECGRATGVSGVLRCSGLNPGASPALANLKFAQNSAHMGLWALDATANGGSQAAHFGNANSTIGINTGGSWIGRPNVSSTQTIGDTGQGAGHIMWMRTASNAWQAYFNGAANNRSGSTASAALTNDDLRIGGIPSLSQFSANRILAAHIGPQLPVTGNLNMASRLYDVLLWYKGQVGA